MIDLGLVEPVARYHGETTYVPVITVAQATIAIAQVPAMRRRARSTRPLGRDKRGLEAVEPGKAAGEGDQKEAAEDHPMQGREGLAVSQIHLKPPP